jgi:lysozyme family protein
VARSVASTLIMAVCDERLRFLQSLHTWPVFGKGWGRRVAEVRRAALAMAAQQGG